MLFGFPRCDSITIVDYGASECSLLSGYFVTAPNLVGHGNRVSPLDYRFSSIAEDLRPYIEAREYSLIIGHSVGALTALTLSAHLPWSHPTAIVLLDPALQATQETISFHEKLFADLCKNPKPAEAHAVENPLWKETDDIFRELGIRLSSVDAVHSIFQVRVTLVRTPGMLIRFFLPSKTSRGTFSIISIRCRRSGK